MKRKLEQVEKEKRKVDKERDSSQSHEHELGKRLATQRTAADTRLLQEQRRFEKMRTHLEEEKKNALDRLKRSQEDRLLEEERMKAAELEREAEKVRNGYLEREMERTIELEEELLQREETEEAREWIATTHTHSST